jgi:tetratricopeptide (TPR) repeat protein
MGRQATARCAAIPVALLACLPAPRYEYTPADLRAELRRRAPAFAPEAIVVPFELPDAARARALELVREDGTDALRVRHLVQAMFDPAGFGLHYAEAETVGAAETLRRRYGNCLDLASVFIGLARAAGLHAQYMDASAFAHSTKEVSAGISVRSGHVTAMVETGTEKVGLDFSRQGPFQSYRLMDDVEAVAHFHNNRGWDGIDRALASDAPPDWGTALEAFRAAVALAPGFGPGWNNVGIASARLGRRAEAVASYRRAISASPGLLAPRMNLASLLLAAGDAEGAVVELEAAARLNPRDPRIAPLLERASEPLEPGTRRRAGGAAAVAGTR